MVLQKKVYLDPWETFCVEVPIDSVFHFEGFVFISLFLNQYLPLLFFYILNDSLKIFFTLTEKHLIFPFMRKQNPQM